ncbi:MAG: ribosome silencing factor [Desulfobacteraceae bacterium]
MKSLEKAILCLRLVKERKALDPLLFEAEALTSLTDYFLVTSGGSTRQVQAIAGHLSRKMREAGLKPLGVEGEEEGRWVLMDFGDVVIHVFYQPVREFYDLEGLWVEAPRIEVQDDEPSLEHEG